VVLDSNAVQLVLPSSLQVNGSDDHTHFPADEQSEAEVSKFCGRSIVVSEGWHSGEFGKSKCIARSLEERDVLAKRISLSSSVYMAREVSCLKNSWVRVFTRLRGNTDSGLDECERILRTMFAPVFVSRGELARELGEIRKFLGDLLAKASDRKNMKDIYHRCNRVLKHSGAMALFGVLRSALNEAKKSML